MKVDKTSKHIFWFNAHFKWCLRNFKNKDGRANIWQQCLMLTKVCNIGSVGALGQYPVAQGTHAPWAKIPSFSCIVWEKLFKQQVGTHLRGWHPMLGNPRSINGSGLSWYFHCLDAFQIHGPDFGTPFAEVVCTMDELVRAGKVRYVGACNLFGWQMQKFVDETKLLGASPWVTLQVCLLENIFKMMIII